MTMNNRTLRISRTPRFATLSLLALTLLAPASLLHAGANITTSAGIPVRWPSGTDLRFIINPSGVPGFTGELDRLVVAGAVRDAFRVWTVTPNAAIAFNDLGLSTAADPPAAADAISHVTFSSTTTSFPPGVLAITGTRFLVGDGRIVDADISYNPTPVFGQPLSPVAAPGTIDLVAVGVHEIGHLLGLDHSGVAAAIMKASVTQTGSVANRLVHSDDAVNVAAIYPLPTFAPSTGRISGVITTSVGTTVRSAHVVAISTPGGQPVASQLTDSTGSYRIEGLPPGNYRLLVEPLDGPALLEHLGSFYAAGAANFPSTFFGGQTSPATITLAAGQSVPASLQLPTQPLALLNLNRIGLITGSLGFLDNDPLYLPRGRQFNVVVSETTTSTDTNMSFSSPDVPASSTTGGTLGSTPIRSSIINIPVPAAVGSYNVTLSNGTGFSTMVGGAVITNNPQIATPLREAAGYSSAIAPGSIVSIFSTATQDLASSSNSAVAVPLPTTLSGISVMVNNRFAPLFFAGPGQINALIPFETPVGSANITVFAGPDAAGNTAVVPVSPSAPGIFAMNQAGTGQGAIINPSGSIAGPASVPAGASTPATRGGVIIIFAAGLGRVTPALPSGLPSGINGTTIPTLVTLPTVRIGGQAATVLFAGLAPNFVGLYQVNVLVPANAQTGNAVPVTITTAEGQTSNTVTVAIN